MVRSDISDLNVRINTVDSSRVRLKIASSPLKVLAGTIFVTHSSNNLMGCWTVEAMGEGRKVY